MSPHWLIGYCGVLLSISAFSVDILLPFFPAMRVQLDAPYPSVRAGWQSPWLLALLHWQRTGRAWRPVRPAAG